MSSAYYPAISAPRTVATMRRPRCGLGRLFGGIPTVADACEQCGLDLRANDTGDGPAVILILLLGAPVVPLALLVEVRVEPTIWVHMVVLPPPILGIALDLLQPFKAFFVAQQYRHRSTAVVDATPGR